MNKKQYNNVIEYTLKHEQSAADNGTAAIGISEDKIKVGIVFGLLNTASTINSLGNNSVQDDIRDIKDCVDAFSYYMAYDNKVYKKSNSITYKVSLLMKSPLDGREIKIESSDGNKDIYTLQNASYESAQLVASIYAHNITIYKVAPYYTYYYEDLA